MAFHRMLVLSVLVLFMPALCHGYRADASTDDVVRLLLSVGVPAPTNYVVWFVLDTNNDGVPTDPKEGEILGPDDQLILSDLVDGELAGEHPGRYRRVGILVEPESLSNANVIVYLWNVQSGTAQGLAGQTFGTLDLGVNLPPQFGNAEWNIASPVFADQFTVAAVDAVAERLDLIQQQLDAATGELGDAVVNLLNTNRAAASSILDDAIVLADQLLSSALAQETADALGVKTGFVEKMVALFHYRLLKAKSIVHDLSNSDTVALHAAIKALKSSQRMKRLRRGITTTDPFPVVTELRSKKGGFHDPGDEVCFRIRYLDGGDGSSCGTPEVLIENLPSSGAANVVEAGVAFLGPTGFCVTMGTEAGGASVAVTACNRTNVLYLFNFGP